MINISTPSRGVVLVAASFLIASCTPSGSHTSLDSEPVEPAAAPLAPISGEKLPGVSQPETPTPEPTTTPTVLVSPTCEPVEVLEDGFGIGSWEVPAEMARIVESAIDNFGPGEVLVVGHTDADPTEIGNETLSLNRAQAVKDLLVVYGVGADRIKIEGAADREPVASNTTQAGRKMNRRIEIFVGCS